MMNDIERIPEGLIEQAKLVDVIDLAGRYTVLSERGRERFGPCPKCGGTDRFHCTADWWFCRRCLYKGGDNGEPKKCDAIDFVMWLDGREFREAVEMLTGGTLPRRRPAAAGRNDQRKDQAKQPADWHLHKRPILERAQYALWNKDGTAGAAYLERRCLVPATWLAFGLGFRPDVAIPGTDGEQRAPGIVLPWFAGGRLVALRYRFVETQNGHKLTSELKSEFRHRLFGGQALAGPETATSLLIVEGEINSLSCWQVAHNIGVDVLSIGTENNSELSPKAIEYAMRYECRLVWADQASISTKLLAQLPDAYAVHSPLKKDADGAGIIGQDGKPLKIDANDMLCAGRLGGFLTAARIDAAQSGRELSMLLLQVVDASCTREGIDHSTAMVAMDLAERLGKPLRLVEQAPDRWVWPTAAPSE